MSVDLFAMPRNYRTAFAILRNKKRLEAYRDDLIPSWGVDTIQVTCPKSIPELGKTAEIYNKMKPDFISFASLTITGFVRESSSYSTAVKKAKEHFIKALKSAGIDSKDVRIEQIGE